MKNTEIKQLIGKYSLNMSIDEYEEFFDFIANKPDDPNEDLWTENILEFSKVVKNHLGNEKAIKFLTSAYEEFLTNYPNSFHNKVNILRSTCYLQMEEKKLEEAHKTMNRYLYNALGQVKFTQNLPKMHYYSFRGVSDYTIDEIKNEKISLSHPRMFNDPLDTILVWWLENKGKRGRK